MRIIFSLILTLMTSFLYAQNQDNRTEMDSSFVIVSKPAAVYSRTYKNGKPFHGFFKTVLPGLNLYLVDEYENGQARYQYSKSGLGEGSEKVKNFLDARSVYQNGKIVDGPEYFPLEGGLTVKDWKQGKLAGFTVDLFAVNYYNRIILEKNADAILIRNLEDTVSNIKIYNKDQCLAAEMSASGKPMFYSRQITFDLEKLPANSRIMGLKKGGITYYNANKNIELTVEPLHVHKINTKLFFSLFLPKTNNLDTVFQHLGDFFSKEEALLIIYKSGAAKEEGEFLTYLQTDAQGKINSGIHWTAGSSPYYETYNKGKVSPKTPTTLAAFQTVFTKYIENQP